MSTEALPISHRSPTVAPTTTQRWPKNGAAPDSGGNGAGSDDDAVLQHRRAGADLDGIVLRPDDGALGEERTLTEARAADHHRRGRDLGCGGGGGGAGGAGGQGWENDGAPSTLNISSSS
jgi:hypothetical protein